MTAVEPEQAHLRLARLLALGAVRAARAAQPSGDEATREALAEAAAGLKPELRAG